MKPLSAKIIATLLTLALIALAACGGASEATEAPATANPTPTAQAPATPTFAFSDPANRITVPAATPTPLPEADMQATAEAEEAANYPRLRTPGPLAEATPEPAPDPTEPPFVVSISPAVDDALSGIYVQPDCLTHYRNMLVDWYYDGQSPPQSGDEFNELTNQWERAFTFGYDTAKELWEEFLTDRPNCSQELTAQFADDHICHSAEMDGTTANHDTVKTNLGGERFPFTLTNMKGAGEFLTYPKIHLNFELMPGHDAPGCWFYQGYDGIWYWRVADGKGTGEIGKETFYAPICDFLLRENLTNKVSNDGRFGPADVLESLDEVRTMEEYPRCATHITKRPDTPPLYFWNLYPSGSASTGCPIQKQTGGTKTSNYIVNWNTEEEPPGDGTVCWVHYSSTGQWKGYTEDGSEVPLFDLRDYIEDWDSEMTASP